ncbi:hypothetical protein F2Q70_00042889 [Brassica cretica]|uniref:Uncharacterized protein n=1 Tax=Brassica cretica TaxID=69181 RepID=A0A8S9KGD9_BRACR|nr:hypothetical protein F2Q70_00042889 [Brassica cretica]
MATSMDPIMFQRRRTSNETTPMKLDQGCLVMICLTHHPGRSKDAIENPSNRFLTSSPASQAFERRRTKNMMNPKSRRNTAGEAYDTRH